MNTKLLTEVTDWLKETDLTELIYKNRTAGFQIRTEAAVPKANIPTCSLSPVTASAVGIYRSAAKGEAKTIKEGDTIKSGDKLGIIEMLGESRPVTASTSGTMKVISIEDGSPVQYGQPLFFIEPN